MEKHLSRIHEIDFLRGIAFLLMVFDHLIVDIILLFSSTLDSELKIFVYDLAKSIHQNPTYYYLKTIFCQAMFIYISGLSSKFSRNVLKNGFKLLIIALSLTAVTFVFSIITDENYTIHFGILHCLACCMILTPILNKLLNYSKIHFVLVGVLLFVIGIYCYNLDKSSFSHYFYFLFGGYPDGYKTMDYFPITPYIFVYMLGMIISNYVYYKKRSLFNNKLYLRPLNFLGRNTLVLYFIHQVILFTSVYIFSII